MQALLSRAAEAERGAEAVHAGGGATQPTAQPAPLVPVPASTTVVHHGGRAATGSKTSAASRAARGSAGRVVEGAPPANGTHSHTCAAHTAGVLLAPRPRLRAGHRTRRAGLALGKVLEEEEDDD